MTAFGMGANEAPMVRLRANPHVQILEKRLACIFGNYFADGVAHSYDLVPVGLGCAGVAGAIDGVLVRLDERAEFHFDAAKFWEQRLVAQDRAGAADGYGTNWASGEHRGFECAELKWADARRGSKSSFGEN